MNIWAVMEAVASVSLSHEEDCRCLTCRAALDKPGAMATLLADLQAREDARTTKGEPGFRTSAEYDAWKADRATRPTGDKE